MTCPNCKNQMRVEGNEYVCSYCGTRVNKPQQSNNILSDKYQWYAFIFPLLGFILYFKWRNTDPAKAKTVLKISLVSLIGGLIIAVIGIVVAYVLKINGYDVLDNSLMINFITYKFNL